MREVPAADTAMGNVSSVRRFVLAWLYADRGALDEARTVAAQLSGYGHVHHFPLEEGRGRSALAEVLRRMGDLEGAERELQVALALAVPLVAAPGRRNSLTPKSEQRHRRRGAGFARGRRLPAAARYARPRGAIS